MSGSIKRRLCPVRKTHSLCQTSRLKYSQAARLDYGLHHIAGRLLIPRLQLTRCRARVQ